MLSPLGFLLLGSFMGGISGGYTSLLMGVMSYVSTIATPDRKTFRISIMYGSASMASLVAFTFSGVLFDATGFVMVYGVSIILYLIGIVYVVFFLKDLKIVTNKNQNVDSKDEFKKDEKKEEKEQNVLKELWTHAKEVLCVAFIKRKYNDRVHIFILMAVIILELLSSGKHSYHNNIISIYMYVRRTIPYSLDPS